MARPVFAADTVGTVTGWTSVLTASWSIVADDVLCLWVYTRGTRRVTSVTGHSLTWTSRAFDTAKLDTGSVQHGLELFTAVATANDTGQITANVGGTSAPIVAFAVRITGADTADFIDATATAGTGSPTGPTDDMKVALDPTNTETLIIATGGHRAVDYTVPSPQISDEVADTGTGGNRMRATLHHREDSDGSATEMGGDNSLSASEEWVIVAIAVKPAAGGATFALAGTAAATAAMTGSVAHSYGLAGSATGVASMTGALAHAYALAGTASGTASMAGAIAHAYGLGGTAAATASMTGAIGHSYTLAGSAAGVATLVGDLTVSGGAAEFALAGSADAVATMAGALGIAYPLDGSAAATASMAGSLGIAYPLVGQADATAALTGSLSLDYALSGSAGAVATMAGQITHAYGLSGTAAATALMVADLTVSGVEGNAVMTLPATMHVVLELLATNRASMTTSYREYDLNDTADPTATFSVSNTNTDPTTISLLVEKPDKTTATYTYALAEITKSATGVYTKSIALDQRGVWRFVFTGTGACAAAAEGTITVRA